jgi:hypothetical protein
MPKIYSIGIDPDTTGAWVLLEDDQLLDYGTFPTYIETKNGKKSRYIDFVKLYEEITNKLLKLDNRPIIMIESVPIVGHTGKYTQFRNWQTIYNCFTFGDYRPTEVSPTQWAKKLGLASNQEDKILAENQTKEFLLSRPNNKRSEKEIYKDFLRNRKKSKAINFAIERSEINLDSYTDKGNIQKKDHTGKADAFCIAYYCYLSQLGE